MNDKTGGTVFPTTEANWHNENVRSEGISVRDYFAAKAMQGWTANPLPNDSSIQDVAAWAYRQADAMIAARTK